MAPTKQDDQTLDGSTSTDGKASKAGSVSPVTSEDSPTPGQGNGGGGTKPGTRLWRSDRNESGDQHDTRSGSAVSTNGNTAKTRSVATTTSSEESSSKGQGSGGPGSKQGIRLGSSDQGDSGDQHDTRSGSVEDTVDGAAG